MTELNRIDKLEAALAAGQLWRAKEILAGRLGSGGFDATTCEQLGRVLLQMGDDLQAGKYLFLSGVRAPEYAGPIELFRRRHGRAGWQSLLGSLPASARRAAWADLPAALREDLRAAGVPQGAGDETIRRSTERHALRRSAAGCATFLLVLLAAGLLISWFLVSCTRIGKI